METCQQLPHIFLSSDDRFRGVKRIFFLPFLVSISIYFFRLVVFCHTSWLDVACVKLFHVSKVSFSILLRMRMTVGWTGVGFMTSLQ